MTYKELGFVKTAKTALIRKLRQGLISEQAVADVSKKLKLKPREISYVDKGTETVVYKVTDPVHGVAVQKHHDPTAWTFSLSRFSKKNKMSEKLNQSDNFAKHYGRKKNTLVTTQEYIQPVGPQSVLAKDMDEWHDINNFVNKAQSDAKRLTGTNMHDVTLDNMINRNKIIDYLPATSELGHSAKRMNRKADIDSKVRERAHKAGQGVFHTDPSRLSVGWHESLNDTYRQTGRPAKVLSNKQRRRLVKVERDVIKHRANNLGWLTDKSL